MCEHRTKKIPSAMFRVTFSLLATFFFSVSELRAAGWKPVLVCQALSWLQNYWAVGVGVAKGGGRLCAVCGHKKESES